MIVYIHKPRSKSIETEINLNQKIGSGATALVYKITYKNNDYAAKIYHDKKRFNVEKIKAMLENRPSGVTSEESTSIPPKFSWPIAWIKNIDGEFIGYLMPLIDIKESFSLDYYYDPGLFSKINSKEEAALSYKIEIARNIAECVADLHSHKHHFIDLKPQNIRVFRHHHCVSLLDCDGFAIYENGKVFPAELVSTDYIAPEALRQWKSAANLSEPQDLYALAVLFFQLLNRGTHPFQGILDQSILISANTNDDKAAAGLYPHGIIPNNKIRPRQQSIHHLLPVETRKLFDRAFISTNRPTAREWFDHFDQLLKQKLIVRCELNPHDFMHMRFRDLGCPTCYLEKLKANTVNTQNKKRENTQVRPTSATPIQPASANTASDNSGLVWFLIIMAVLLLVIFIAAPSNNTNGSQSSDYSPVTVTQPLVTENPSSFQDLDEADSTISDQANSSGLPSCPSDVNANWHLCFGSANYRGYEYEGEWRNDQPNGSGKATWPKGETYVGQWLGGTMHGMGVYTYANGEKESGKFINGKFVKPNASEKAQISNRSSLPACPINTTDTWQNCIGTYTDPNGYVFTGPWRNDQLTGSGKVVVPKGFIYVGEFKENVLLYGIKYDLFCNFVSGGEFNENFELITSRSINVSEYPCK